MSRVYASSVITFMQYTKSSGITMCELPRQSVGFIRPPFTVNLMLYYSIAIRVFACGPFPALLWGGYNYFVPKAFHNNLSSPTYDGGQGI